MKKDDIMNQYIEMIEESTKKRVFLGGTCNNSTWRQEMIPKLTIDYFNPVVYNWTEECQKEEQEQRKTCSICLYVITPKMSGTYSIAEVVDDSNKRPKKTVLVTLRTDSGDKFTDTQWKSLGEVYKLVLRNGGQCFDTLEEAAHYINRK